MKPGSNGGENKIEVKIQRQYSDTPCPIIHKTEHPNFEARLAVNLLEK